MQPLLRLTEIYDQLRGGFIVSSTAFTPVSIAKITQLLNDARPKDCDSDQARLIRTLAQTDQDRFAAFVTASEDIAPLVLWLRDKDIARHFDLNNRLSISYSAKGGYAVTPRRSSRRQRSVRGNTRRPRNNRRGARRNTSTATKKHSYAAASVAPRRTSVATRRATPPQPRPPQQVQARRATPAQPARRATPAPASRATPAPRLASIPEGVNWCDISPAW